MVVCMAGCISLSPIIGKNAPSIGKDPKNRNEAVYHQVDEPQSSVAAIRTVDTELAVLLTACSSFMK